MYEIFDLIRLILHRNIMQQYENSSKTKVVYMKAFIKFTYSVRKELFYSLNSLQFFTVNVNIDLRFYNQ